jgi:hypothetical protein
MAVVLACVCVATVIAVRPHVQARLPNQQPTTPPVESIVESRILEEPAALDDPADGQGERPLAAVSPVLSAVTLQWAAGTYGRTSAYGRESLRIASSGYTWTTSGTDTKRVEKGSVRATEAGLELEPKGRQASLLVPMHREECWYLVEAPNLQATVELLRAAGPRDVLPALFHRAYDEEQGCGTVIEVPTFYRRSILEGIVAREVQDAESSLRPPRRILVDRGSDDGMWVGLRMRNDLEAASDWAGRVVDVRTNTSVLELNHPPAIAGTRWTSRRRLD